METTHSLNLIGCNELATKPRVSSRACLDCHTALPINSWEFIVIGRTCPGIRGQDCRSNVAARGRPGAPWKLSPALARGCALGSPAPWAHPNLSIFPKILGGGGVESERRGLNLSGSWQQGHSATYNTPSRI